MNGELEKSDSDRVELKNKLPEIAQYLCATLPQCLLLGHFSDNAEAKDEISAPTCSIR